MSVGNDIHCSAGRSFFLTFHLIFPWQLAPTEEHSSHSSCGVLSKEPAEEKSGQAAIALLIPNPRSAINALMGPV